MFDKQGKQIEQIQVQERRTANACISGKDRRILFITASQGFYSICLRNKAANPAK